MLHTIPEQRPSPDTRTVWLPDPSALPILLLEAEASGWRVISVVKRLSGLTL